MPDNQPASRIDGKTFVLVHRSSDEYQWNQATNAIAHLGGELVQKVTPDLDYLVILDLRPTKISKEERRVKKLGPEGEAIQVLNRRDFCELISPTPEEAWALLTGGEEGLAEWRLRRDDLSETPIDLSGADLRGRKLNQIVLYRVKLDDADLEGADLSGSCLGELVRVNLDGALLKGAYVPYLVDCSLRGADLTHVRLNPAVITRSDFTGAKLTRINGSYTVSQRAIFQEADLTRAELDNSSFLEANFDRANLTEAQLDRCDLTGASFRGADLRGARLNRAKLINADLSHAKFVGANLAGADLTGATVEGTDFEGANLYAANLDALGPGKPLHLLPPPPIAWERIGPNMRILEETWQKVRYFDTSICIDPDGSETEFLQLIIDAYGSSSARAFASTPTGSHPCQAETICEAMLEMAQRWPDAELYLETLRVRTGSVRGTPKELAEQTLAAWHEAFAQPFPSRD
ncbi:MAG: pentapeptide repeat-containing protein, partial [Planctomycetaceae bacterium]|nr:pentapeptide repeat-containing protein [Planctomycetaceae bacterium]